MRLIGVYFSNQVLSRNVSDSSLLFPILYLVNGYQDSKSRWSLHNISVALTIRHILKKLCVVKTEEAHMVVAHDFVYFVGPLCKMLGHHSFKSKENRTSSTRRACSAEVYRQLCNTAYGREDGGKDKVFENNLLADFVSKVLDRLYQASKWFSIAAGKDILTSGHIMSQDRKYSDLPLRTRNMLSRRTRDTRS